MATELITITREDAVILAVDFVGPLGNYFGKLCRYFHDESAVTSVDVDFSEVPGFHKSWTPAVKEALNRIRAAFWLDVSQSMAAEQKAERRNEEILAGFDTHFEEEFSSFGYV